MPAALADVGLADIEEAAARLRGIAWRTPLFPASRDEERVFLKMEALQRLGSFKIRGAWNRMSRATPDERRRGFVTVSAGNHGQAVAWSARKLAAPCTVWVPETAVQRKVESMRSMGATVKTLPHEEIMEAMKTASTFARADGATYIHPFGDPFVVAGAGTVGLEVAQDLPAVKTALVPVGGGGLVCGIAAALKAKVPGVKIYGVQAEGADPLPQSFERGGPVTRGPPQTFADGMAATRVFDYMWPLLHARLDGALRVDDVELQRAVVHLAKESHVIAEGAGAAALAAAWRYADRLEGPVCCIVSGGNLDPTLLARFLHA